MGGIGFLLVIILYIVGSAALVAKVPTLKFKIVALLAVLLIPTADAIYGRIKLQQMCKAEGGLRVYKVAHNVEGYMNGWAEPDKYTVEHQGYKFEESKERLGVCNRVSMQDGELVYEKNVPPKSKYRVYLAQRVALNDDFWYQDDVVETYPAGEQLLRYRVIAFNGGWAEKFLGSFSDAGANSVFCEKQWPNERDLIKMVLKTGDK